MGQNMEQTGIFIDICERLYEDILENAKESEQIQRLKPDILEPS